MWDTLRDWTCLDLPVTIRCVDGATIKRLREARGLTQPELATLVGVGARTIGNWERDETIPKNRLGRLEEVLGVTRDQGGGPLRSMSDSELLAELLRRAVARDRAV